MKPLLTKLILFQYINELNFLYPVYILLFQKHGLDAISISILLAIWGGAQLLFEIPTGILADKYSRRNLILIGRVVKVCAFITWLGAGSGFLFGPFWYFAIGFILWGLSGALFSGTFLALVYDELKIYGRENEYEKVQGWLTSASVGGVATALFLGGIVAEISYAYVFVLSIVSSCIAFGIMFIIKPVQQVRSTGEKDYLKFLIVALQKARRDFYLGKLMFLLVAVTAVYGTIEEFYPFIFSDLGFKEGIVGILFGINVIFIFLGTIVVGYISLRKGNWESTLAMIGGIGFMILGIGKQPIYLAGIFIAAFAITIFEIRLTNKIQNQIESHERATILSVNSFLSEGFGLILFILFGFIIDRYDGFHLMSVVGLGLLVFSILGMLLFWRKSPSNY